MNFWLHIRNLLTIQSGEICCRIRCVLFLCLPSSSPIRRQDGVTNILAFGCYLFCMGICNMLFVIYFAYYYYLQIIRFNSIFNPLSCLCRLALQSHAWLPVTWYTHRRDVCSNSWEHISSSGEVSVFNIWEHIHEMCLSIVYGFIIGLYSWFYMTEFGLICEHTFEARLYSHTLFRNARILKLSLPIYNAG